MIYFKPDSDENSTCIRAFDGETVIGNCTIDVNGYECSEFDTVLKLLGFVINDGVYSGEIPELLKGSCCKN